jgi:hypothetical protein
MTDSNLSELFEKARNHMSLSEQMTVHLDAVFTNLKAEGFDAEKQSNVYILSIGEQRLTCKVEEDNSLGLDLTVNRKFWETLKRSPEKAKEEFFRNIMTFKDGSSVTYREALFNNKSMLAELFDIPAFSLECNTSNVASAINTVFATLIASEAPERVKTAVPKKSMS